MSIHYIIEKLEFNITIEDFYNIYAQKPHTVILDSSMKNQYGKYSILAFEPFMLFKSKGLSVQVIKNNCIENHTTNPIDFLKKLLKRYKTNSNQNILPFNHGCIGFFSYDLGRFFEELPEDTIDDKDIPDIYLGFYDCAIIFDHAKNTQYLSVSSANIDDADDCPDCCGTTENINSILKKRADETKISIAQEIDKLNSKKNTDLYSQNIDAINLKSNHTKDSYCLMVKKAREYIQNGDIYQVNLSQRFEIEYPHDPYNLFVKLREICPTPFSAFLNFGNIKVISASPERFIKIKDNIIETRPIKGTRPRGKTPIEDTILRNELINSKKDMAELTMITDLLRNDIGKVCKIGSVTVEKLFEIEEYTNVFHLVSTIKGELRDNIDVTDCLKATFPGGSITGAPKIRAMEIIEEQEPTKRNIYTGSIGYIDFSGNADLNIVIRTVVIKDNKAFYSVGGGIVWDSDEVSEYQETLYKGISIMTALTNGT